jgi:biotin carboxylase
LLRHLPRHYASAAVAEYPCVLKAAEGQFGKGVHIVRDAAEVC